MDDSIKKEIIVWNNRFPIDRWYRQKHNIAFNSSIHRESNFLDQLFEYREDELFEEHQQAQKYEPNTGNWLIKQEKTEEQQQLSLIDEARREMKDLPDEF
jgi:hypothetical protein